MPLRKKSEKLEKHTPQDSRKIYLLAASSESRIGSLLQRLDNLHNARFRTYGLGFKVEGFNAITVSAFSLPFLHSLLTMSVTTLNHRTPVSILRSICFSNSFHSRTLNSNRNQV